VAGRLWTARYADLDPRRAVPVQTSLSAPRWAGYAVVPWPAVMPFGLIDVKDQALFRRRYRARLHRLTPRILRELAELREMYAGWDLVLACYEDLTKPGVWCHRSLLGEWLREKGVIVEELSHSPR
jgi:hypothetical protein